MKKIVCPKCHGEGGYPLCETCKNTMFVWRSEDDKELDYWKANGFVKPDSWVVCAANRHKISGRIVCGARHWDAVMRSQVKDGEGFCKWDQGFINQFCEFLTRDEAFEIAKKNGQIKELCYETQDSMLFSENLY